jgi:hypothetical protein
LWSGIGDIIKFKKKIKGKKIKSKKIKSKKIKIKNIKIKSKKLEPKTPLPAAKGFLGLLGLKFGFWDCLAVSLDLAACLGFGLSSKTS